MPEYRKAEREDIPLLVEIRLKLLRSANGLPEAEPLAELREKIEDYYKNYLRNEEHIAILAFEGNHCVGTGAICFYKVLPTCHNPSGRKAYIINMYTEPEFRRQGIATKILDMLVQESLQQGVDYITLEATGEGRKVYEKYGFMPVVRDMQLNNATYEAQID